MNNNEYRCDLIKGLTVHTERDTLHIEGVDCLPATVDYSDSDGTKWLASAAVYTADGFYDLVKENCNIESPDISHGAHLEMYLALSGLACEIYMKAIIYHENIHDGKQVKGHRLDDLFGKLPNAIQETLKSKINNIKGVILTISDIFTTLRYDFELNYIHGDYLVVFNLMEELRIIAHTYPKKQPGAIKFTNGVLVFE